MAKKAVTSDEAVMEEPDSSWSAAGAEGFMSEFLIICGKKPQVDGLANVLLVDLMDAESLVVEAAEALLSAEDRAEAFTVRDAEGCFDTLFAEAQRELLDGK